ncbi:MAG: leucine-rich repeat protein, partial [Muribaculaceae bacterium]|nr:leucine-rich repeat protein [Muribaculaceae bacterium]
PEGIQKIGFGAFYDDNYLECITFPHTLTEIGDWAFIYNRSLTEIDIPNSVKRIGIMAFYQCYGITNITLGSGLEWVGDEAFHVDSDLETVTCSALIPPVTPEPDPQYYDVGLFTVENYNNAKLYVPASSLGAYQTATEWKNFKTMVPFVTLDEALNVAGGTLRFDGVGDYPWQVVSEGGRDYATSSNAGAASTSSVLTTSVTVNSPSTLSFDYLAWGEGTATHWDACRFAVDGVVMFDEGALDNDWMTYTTELQPGTHTLTWSYTKDTSVNPTGDYFAVDNVSITSNALRGDVNGDGGVDISDATTLINYLLTGNADSINLENANCDQTGGVDISDATTLINYLLNGTW